jgi:hypothetical protein
LLDAQNCSGESAIWRAMFHGLRGCAHLLLHEGALPATAARVQLLRPKRVRIIFGFKDKFLHRCLVDCKADVYISIAWWRDWFPSCLKMRWTKRSFSSSSCMDRRRPRVAADPTEWLGLSLGPWPTVLR